MGKNAQLLLLAMIILAMTLIVMAMSTTNYVFVGGREENNLLPRYAEVREKFPELMGEKLNTTYNPLKNPLMNKTIREKTIRETFNATVSEFSALLAQHGILFTNTSFKIINSTWYNWYNWYNVTIDYVLLISDATHSIRDPGDGFRRNSWRYNFSAMEWELKQDKYV